MLGSQFYFQSIRKYVALFGALFDDISIIRNDANGVMVSLEKVPLKYAPKDKILIRLKEDPTLDQKDAIKLPVMSFEMQSPQYDEDRKLNSIGRNSQRIANTTNYFTTQYNPVPYNFPFTLYVYAKHTEDMTKIVEQIYPFFRPEYTVTAQMIAGNDLEKRDIPIVLVNSTYQDTYEDDFQTRKVILWQFNFVLKGFFWGPAQATPIIKFVTTNYRVANSVDNITTVTVRPGLDANGDPTSIANNSIDPLLIDVTDDYGFVEVYSGLYSN